MRVAACDGKMPFDVAFSVGDDFLIGWLVVKGEIEGGEFDWRSMRWLERK